MPHYGKVQLFWEFLLIINYHSIYCIWKLQLDYWPQIYIVWFSCYSTKRSSSPWPIFKKKSLQIYFRFLYVFQKLLLTHNWCGYMLFTFLMIKNTEICLVVLNKLTNYSYNGRDYKFSILHFQNHIIQYT